MSNSFRDSSLWGAQFGKVNRLSGFRKGHRVPEDHFDAAQDFVRKIGHEEVKQLSETIYSGLRSSFAYKRKQMQYVCESGTAALKTPDFDVNLELDQDPIDPSSYQLSTEVTNIQSMEVVSESAFCSMFNPYCNHLTIRFEKAIELESKIDAIEENETFVAFLDYEADCSSFTINIPSPNIRFEFTPHRILVTLPGERNLRKLINHCGAAFEAFTEAGIEVIKLSNE